MEANNNQKLREALIQIRDSVYIDPDNNRCHSDIDSSDLREICDVALAEPPRNCDVGTAEEQAERFLTFCTKHATFDGCGECPLYCSDRCEIAWTQMPYEKRGAE